MRRFAVTALGPSQPTTPPGWRPGARSGFGPFVSSVEFELEDGSRQLWHSRQHRKSDLVAAEQGISRVPARTWWIAILFSIGAACFAVGSAQTWVDFVSDEDALRVFFIGSIFFTAAAYLSFEEVSGTPSELGDGVRREVRIFSFRPVRIEWWATAIQLLGTLFFNLSTFDAMRGDLSARQSNELVWWPDVAGSVCFLIASYLAWAEVCNSAGRLRTGDVSWWIVLINLVGSVLFAMSAVGAEVVASSGAVRNADLVAVTTFGGGISFLVGAALLIPEARRVRVPSAATTTAG